MSDRRVIQAKNISEIALSWSGRWLATGTRDSTVRIFDTATGKLATRIGAGGEERWPHVTGLRFTPDETQLVFASRGSLQRVNIETRELVPVVRRYGALIDHDVGSSAPVLVHGGPYLRSYKTWNGPATTLPVDPTRKQTRAVVSPDGRWFAAVGGLGELGLEDERLHLFAATDPRPRFEYPLGSRAASYRGPGPQWQRSRVGFISAGVAIAAVRPRELSNDKAGKYIELARRKGDPPLPDHSMVTSITTTGVVVEHPWPRGFHPHSIAFSRDAIFGVNFEQRLVRMDPATGVAIEVANTGVVGPLGFAVSGDGSLAALVDLARLHVHLVPMAVRPDSATADELRDRTSKPERAVRRSAAVRDVPTATAAKPRRVGAATAAKPRRPGAAKLRQVPKR